MTEGKMPTRPFACTICRSEYGGWNAFRLANGIIELYIVPELGGRIIQLRFGCHEFFYVNSLHRGRIYRPEENCLGAGWKDYGGSKVWPAPQGWDSDSQWPGPPDPVLDGGSYSYHVAGDSPDSAAIFLESPRDEYTGLSFSREIRVFENSSAVRIVHQMRNSSLRPVRWGIWQVTQQAAHQPLIVYAPARRSRQMFGDEAYNQVEIDAERGLWKLEYRNQVAKFAVEAEQGWLVAIKPKARVALVERFPLFSDLPYPDGVPLEFWVNGSGTFTIHKDRIRMDDNPDGCDPFIETEILSPLTDLEPGQQFAFPVTWQCTAVSSPMVSAVNSCALISEPLEIYPADGQLRVSGAFGPFQPGSLEMVVLDRSGKLVATKPLGNITPLTPCKIDETIAKMENLARVSLRLRAPAGGLLGTVAEVPLIP
jgi:uncharacterized protein DUF4380